MGREIRKVPPNWEHPKTDRYGDGRYQPLYDQRFSDAVTEWNKEFLAWRAPGGEGEAHPDMEFWEWHGGPPEREYYREYADADATWVQVYETVSEGTPVTPPFATPEELVDYLATNGDFWDQKRGDGPWERANAEKFVKAGWAVSFMVETTQSGVTVRAPRDGI